MFLALCNKWEKSCFWVSGTLILDEAVVWHCASHCAAIVQIVVRIMSGRLVLLDLLGEGNFQEQLRKFVGFGYEIFCRVNGFWHC